MASRRFSAPQVIGILVDVALNRVAGRVFDRLMRREIGESLRQVDGVVFLRKPRHFPDDGFGELGRLLRTAWFHCGGNYSW